jgi:hypothetical protein
MNILYIPAFIFLSFSLSGQTDDTRKTSSFTNNNDKRNTQTTEVQTPDSRDNQTPLEPAYDKALKTNGQSETNKTSRESTTEEPNSRRETEPKKKLH